MCKVHIISSHINSPLFSDEGPPCTCPLCASDWSSCVPHSEGLQLSRDLGATYLELPSLNHVFVGRYFGSVVSDDATQESHLMLGHYYFQKRKDKYLSTHLILNFSCSSFLLNLNNAAFPDTVIQRIQCLVDVRMTVWSSQEVKEPMMQKSLFV